MHPDDPIEDSLDAGTSPRKVGAPNFTGYVIVLNKASRETN